MNGKMIGYVRVSTITQNPQRQLDGIKLDKIFTDKASGKDVRRPQLDALLHFVREDDIVIIHSMDRLARNLDNLRELIRSFTLQGVKVQFIKENLIFTGEDTPISNLLLSVMGAFAEFERALIRERQLEGIALAQRRGAYKGRKKALNEEKIKLLHEKVKMGNKKTDIAKEFGISRASVYVYLNLNKAPYQYSYRNST